MDTLQSSDNYFSTLLSGNEGVRYQCINVTDIKKKIGVVQLVAFWYIKCTIAISVHQIRIFLHQISMYNKYDCWYDANQMNFDTPNTNY